MACSDVTDDNVKFSSVDTAILRVFKKSSDLNLALFTQTKECYEVSYVLSNSFDFCEIIYINGFMKFFSAL